MRRKNSIPVVILFILLNSLQGFAELPEPLELNGIWKFALAEDDVAAETFGRFYDPSYDDEAFSEIEVPGHWVLQGFEEPHYVNGTRSEGFYRTTFRVPGEASGQRAILQFDGVWVSAEVWLNGVNLGRHDSGFTAFEFDVTEELLPGEENTLAVRVRQQIPASLFKFDANDDWGLPGIYRDVRIRFTPKQLYIANVEVSTDLDDEYKDAFLDLRVMVIRDEKDHYIAPSDPFLVRSRLLNPEGELVQLHETSVRVAGGNNGTDVRFRQLVRGPLLWTAESPHLYHLEVEIVRDQRVVHSWSDSIGFREVSTAGGVLRINGRVVKLRGVASHDLHPDVGRATTRDHWLRDIRLMKEANINTVRMAHYPHAEGFVRLCDELGLYVIDEIPLGFGGDRMEDPVFAAGMLLRIHETILRDRNRPSVIVWSFGNEDGLTYLHTVGLRAIKGIDPTRPVLLPFRAEPWLPGEVDIFAPHYWTAVEYDALGAEADRPVVTTEYTHALGDGGVGELEDRWMALTRHPAGAGGMIWLWADQGLYRKTEGRFVADPMKDKDKYTREGSELVGLSEPIPGTIIDAHGNYGTDGIVTADRQPTRDYLEAKAVYAPVRVLEQSIWVEPSATQLRIPIYNGFDFTDLESVSLEWALMDGPLTIFEDKTRLSAKPHTTTILEVPLPQVSSLATHLAVKVSRADGSRMASYSVRLFKNEVVEEDRAAQPLMVDESEQSVSVQVGRVRFEFDKGSGELVEISRDGVVLVDSAYPVVWRPATYNERNRYDRRDNQHDWNTYMSGLSGRAIHATVNEVEDGVAFSSSSEYVLDERNQLTVHSTYTIQRDGGLRVRLRIEPVMDIPEIPEVGMAFGLAMAPQRLNWMGQGPYDSVPGNTAATTFGYWNVEAQGDLAKGTKSGVEWGRLDFSKASVECRGLDGLRLEGGDPWQFRVLTHVGGAWTKNGPPENPSRHLDLKDGKSFEGEFLLRIK